ncbi:MAG: GNAT family N-acetyltransferase [Flavobacteriaceae bacterium]|nr:GNAT family N-acetyltransferase [Flavobacteriaceae bacterium]
MTVLVRPIKKSDWNKIAEIYQEGIDTGIATFENKVPTWDYWCANHYLKCSFVAETGENVIGFACLAPVSKREVYKGVAESSVYISTEYKNLGIGKLLLDHLILESESQGYWTLQASIFRENSASLQLHSKCGFREIGFREKVAKRNGKWYDNILMERRSPKIN